MITHHTTFSQLEQDRIASFNPCCIFCESTTIQAAHVVSSHDRSVFHVPGYQLSAADKSPQIPRLTSLGLINFQIDSYMNGVTLCPLCHANFNDFLSPAFFFIPTDLDYFIEYERQDRIRRFASVSTATTPTSRQCSTADDYRSHMIEKGHITAAEHGGLYRFFLLDPPRAPLFPTYVPLRPWHGAPMAAIRRGVYALGQGGIGGRTLPAKRLLKYSGLVLRILVLQSLEIDQYIREEEQ